VSVLFEPFEATRVDHVECLDAQSKPPRLLLVCHECALSQEWLVVCLRQCTVELILQKQEAERRFLLKSRDGTALKTRFLWGASFGNGNAPDLP